MVEQEQTSITPLVERFEGALYGDLAPKFTVNLDNLNKIFRKVKSEQIPLLYEAVARVDGYLGEIEKFKTSDAYEWLKAYEFKRGEAKIIVAFPQLDGGNRSIALYITGETGKWTAHVLVAHLSGPLQNLQRMQPQKSL